MKSWGMPIDNGCGKFQDIDNSAIAGLKELSISHVWLTGIIRHATGNSYPENNLPGSNPQIMKGIAGSPYAIKDYYDVDPDLAETVDKRMDEFEALVQRIHNQGLKVIIDFVPNHVSRDYSSENKPSNIKNLGENDNSSFRFLLSNNFYYLPGQKLELPGKYGNKGFQENPAKATGNDIFSPNPSKNDWYETIKLNYGIDPQYGIKQFDPIPDTWNKMTDILRFWSEKGVDGFRCDMAGMIPVEFWNFAIGKIKDEYNNTLFIAEIYEPEKYRDFIETAGFDYLYDKLGLYDTLKDIICGKKNTDSISSVWQKLDGLDKHMLRFLENHDEQRIASGHFAGDGLKGLPGMALSSMMNTGPVMIYNGQEVGEDARGATGFSGDDGHTSIFDYCSMPEFQKWVNNGAYDGGLLSEDQKKLRKLYSDLLEFTRSEPEFSGQFYDLMWQNQDLDPGIKNKIYAFLRYNEISTLLIVISFSHDIKNIRIRVPYHALENTALAGKDRISASYLYPEIGESNLMMSQIGGSGISVSLKQAGWAAIRIE